MQLLSLLPRRPLEFVDRALAMVSARWELSFGGRPGYEAIDIREGIARLSGALGREATDELGDTGLARFEAQLRERQSRLPAKAPFETYHNGDTLLGRICYFVARATRPTLVVETGVCYGVTSSYLLQALEDNDHGHLHSVDLPPLGRNGDDYVGWLIPAELRSRWTLHRGTSRRVLRPLLEEIKGIELFIHDSLHTHRNMRDEFGEAWHCLRPGGVLISDDIQGNSAFMQLASQPDVDHSIVLREQAKDFLLGVAVKVGKR